MKKLFVLAAVCVALTAHGVEDRSFEVLLATGTTTELPANHIWRGRLIQNRGPNEIFCVPGPQADAGYGAVVDKSFGIVAGGTLYWPTGATRLFCVSKTADQVTGAATAVVGVP